MTDTVIVMLERMNASRLPGKPLIEIGGKTAMEIACENIKPTGYPIVVATTDDPSDAPIVREASRLKIPVILSERGVVRALHDACDAFRATNAVRVTADDIFVDAELLGRMIREHVDMDIDYSFCDAIPRGFDADIFSIYALYKMYDDDPENEMVGYARWEERFRVRDVVVGPSLDLRSKISLNLDTSLDLENIRSYVGLLGTTRITLKKIAKFLATG